MTKILAVLLALIGVACKKAQPPTPRPAAPAPTITRSIPPEQNIIIFPAAATGRRDSLQMTPPFWEPTPEQIRRLEASLLAYLNSSERLGLPPSPLETYGRQYFGISQKGKRLIHLNAFCQPDRFPERRTVEVFVLDGGKCYFKALYDPAQDRFLEFGYNGSA